MQMTIIIIISSLVTRSAYASIVQTTRPTRIRVNSLNTIAIDFDVTARALVAALRTGLSLLLLVVVVSIVVIGLRLVDNDRSTVLEVDAPGDLILVDILEEALGELGTDDCSATTSWYVSSLTTK